ncbi:class I SAM-dependent methyltransferase [Nonomuraea montanisoli]|uniref:class I SAM-dependent methyltransferase n=1 Tax=Nonomuraea montanisoli TaxID=2741721 RepID=UPI002E28F44F|nr:class I SAM-dependent methyltransferase [Nonomuraea montanisoli]
MDLDAFTELLTPRGQRALAEAVELRDADPVAAATRLRRTYDAALASAALTQARLRQRARAKFGADAELMYFTPHGLEQATRAEVAAHRAARLLAVWRGSHDPDAVAPGVERDSPGRGRPESVAPAPTSPDASSPVPASPDAFPAAPASPDAPSPGLASPGPREGAPGETGRGLLGAGGGETGAGHHRAAPGAAGGGHREGIPGGTAQGPGGGVSGRAGEGPEGGVSGRTGGGAGGERPGWTGEGPRVVDVCCGSGGDLLALARAGCLVDAVDTDPLTVAVARANAEALGLAERVTVRVADAASVSPEDYDVLFADPARRTARGRTFDPMAYSPPWPVVLDLLARAPLACLKVAPGIPYEFIPEGAEAEWVSYKGEVKEASLWTSPGAAREAGLVRLATLLPGGHVLRDTGAVAPTGPLGRYVYEPDGAAIRAHLVGEVAELVGGRLADPMIAYITGDDPVDTPWAARYEVEEALPFSLKRLRAALRDRKIGNVTIKKRASAVDIERLRSDLRLSGTESAVVILTRIMDKPAALICRPASPA